MINVITSRLLIAHRRIKESTSSQRLWPPPSCLIPPVHPCELQVFCALYALVRLVLSCVLGEKEATGSEKQTVTWRRAELRDLPLPFITG